MLKGTYKREQGPYAKALGAAAGGGAMENIILEDRRDAGRGWGNVFSRTIGRQAPTVVLGIPRGEVLATQESFLTARHLNFGFGFWGTIWEKKPMKDWKRQKLRKLFVDP
jgi:hypothetical protein